MRILIDIGHPAHVHYFRNLIKILSKKGYSFLLLARDKDVTHELLDAYDLPFIDKGKGGKAIIDRLFYTLKSLNALNNAVKTFQPDICISHASPYLALISAFHKKPHILFNDTERVLFFSQVVKLFKPVLCVPDSFKGLYGKKKIIFRSYMELAYLHPELFSPNPEILDETGTDYILLRFVSEKANHDRGSRGLSDKEKTEIFNKLAEYKKVWISSEEPLPDELKPYKITVPAGSIHDVIAHASLLFGGSATMSSEAAMLGVPSVLTGYNRWGYIEELEENYELVHYFNNDEKGKKAALQKAISILTSGASKELYAGRRMNMLIEKENLTDIMLDIIEKTTAGLQSGQ